MTKAELRLQALKTRKQITDNELNDKSTAIALAVISYLKKRTFTVAHIFLPIRKQKEVDTFLLIDHIRRELPNLQLVVSISDFDTCTMKNYWLRADTTLAENKWGIPEPIQAEPIDNKDIEIVFVPLLAFDEQGYRVGYGKGFYDRFLALCRSDVRKIGLSLYPPVPKITDISSHDISLDACITPSQIYFLDKQKYNTLNYNALFCMQ